MPVVVFSNEVLRTTRLPEAVAFIPFWLKLKIRVSSTISGEPDIRFIPFVPRVEPAPLIRRLRRLTGPVGPDVILTMTPWTPDASIEATCPPPPSIVMGLVIVTAPYPAGSSASISPPDAVFEIAHAKVLQGAVREHGLTSSPTPETHVRVACACATEAMPRQSAPINNTKAENDFITSPTFKRTDHVIGGRTATPRIRQMHHKNTRDAKIRNKMLRSALRRIGGEDHEATRYRAAPATTSKAVDRGIGAQRPSLHDNADAGSSWFWSAHARD